GAVLRDRPGPRGREAGLTGGFMTPAHDWRRLVRDHASRRGADLPPHAIEELAAHLDDLYTAAIRKGGDDAAAFARAQQALNESSLETIGGPKRRLRLPEPADASGFGRAQPLRGVSPMRALRLALRQFRRQPTFSLVTVLVLGLGIGAG